MSGLGRLLILKKLAQKIKKGKKHDAIEEEKSTSSKTENTSKSKQSGSFHE